MKKDLKDFNGNKLNRVELEHVLGGLMNDPPAGIPPILQWPQPPTDPMTSGGTGSG